MLDGACHCGNIEFAIETAIEARDIVLHACDCSFCRMHGATTWSDPDGFATIRVRDAGRLQRYRFGLHTADFLICTECGAYAGALLVEGELAWSTLNLRLSALEAPVETASYADENAAERTARRKRRWTPTSLR